MLKADRKIFEILLRFFILLGWLHHSQHSYATTCEAAVSLSQPELAYPVPDNLIGRLEKYAPNVAATFKKTKPENMGVYYHGAGISPEDLNPVLVTTSFNVNSYFAAAEAEKNIAFGHLFELNDGDSLLSSEIAESLVRAGHQYFGVMLEFRVPKEFLNDQQVINDFFVNDLLLADRIGTVNLTKLTDPNFQNAKLESVIDWFNTVDFLKKFFPTEYVRKLASLRRSSVRLFNDLDQFQTFHHNFLVSKGAFQISKIELLTARSGSEGELIPEYFFFRDTNGLIRRYTLLFDDKKGEYPIELLVNGKKIPFKESMLVANENSLLIAIPGLERKIRVGTKIQDDDSQHDGSYSPIRSRKVSFRFNDSGGLVFEVSTMDTPENNN